MQLLIYVQVKNYWRYTDLFTEVHDHGKRFFKLLGTCLEWCFQGISMIPPKKKANESEGAWNLSLLRRIGDRCLAIIFAFCHVSISGVLRVSATFDGWGDTRSGNDHISPPFSEHFWVGDDFPNFSFGGIWIRSLEGYAYTRLTSLQNLTFDF